MIPTGDVGVASASEWMTVAGRYRLVAVVGTGAMGRVWRAHDELLDREVAIKEVMGPDGLSVAQRRAVELRADRTARAAVSIDDPGVVSVIEVVRTTGRSWIVMEYIESRSLSDRVTQDGPMTHREAALMSLALLRAMRAAHATGVLLYGVRPSRVLIADDGRVLLTGVGMATAGEMWHRTGAHGTQPLLGSSCYVAPERWRGGPATQAADLWSLGATVYTAVEGRPPIFRPGIANPLAAGRAELADRPQNPGPLHPIMARLLTTDPAMRATAGEAQAALEALTNRAVGVFPIPGHWRPTDETVRFRPAVAAVASSPQTPEIFSYGGQDVVAASPRGTLGKVGPLVAAIVALFAAVVAIAVVGMKMGNGRVFMAASDSAPILASTGACAGADLEPVAGGGSTAPVSLPTGWLWHVDAAGFALPVPRGWTRAAIHGMVCFSGPDQAQTFTANPALLADDGPLLHWQAAEISALAEGTVPGYRRVSLDVLPGNVDGAEWEYAWQPASGPQLHTRRVLTTVDGSDFEELSWTTPEQDWTHSLASQHTFFEGFHDRSATASAPPELPPG